MREHWPLGHTSRVLLWFSFMSLEVRMNGFEKLHTSLWFIFHVGRNQFSNFIPTIFSHCANGEDLSDNK